MKRQLRTETLSLVKRRAIIAQRFLSKVAAAITDDRRFPCILHLLSRHRPRGRECWFVRDRRASLVR